MYALREIS